jgi:hypothetical protein
MQDKRVCTLIATAAVLMYRPLLELYTLVDLLTSLNINAMKYHHNFCNLLIESVCGICPNE